jgi:hypothetical protein
VYTSLIRLQKRFLLAGALIIGSDKHAKVEKSAGIDKNIKLNLAFDVSQPTGENALNRKFDSLARFLNMHVPSVRCLYEGVQMSLSVITAYVLLQQEGYSVNLF